MPLDAEQALSVLKIMIERLDQQAIDAQRPLDYYRGEHNMAFASPEFQRMYGGLFTDWSDNWCGVVVDSVAERLSVTGFKAGGKREAHEATWDLWQRSGGAEDLDAAIVTSLTACRSAATVWYPERGSSAPSITFEHPSQMVVAYEPGSRRRRRFALKSWEDEDGRHATLFTPTEVWKFSRVKGGTGWAPREVPGEAWPLPHSFGVVPVVEMRNKPDLLGNAYSEIEQIIPKQDAVNLIWAHIITGSDAAVLPQRIVTGAKAPLVPEVGDDGKVSMREATREEVEKMRSQRMGFLPDKDAKIAEWSAANPGSLIPVVKTLVLHVAAQSKTPPQYLNPDMANLSGEALAAAETGLVSKVYERQTDFGLDLREVMRLAHLANGDEANANAIATGSVVWKDAEHRTLGELVDALLKKKTLGVPLEVLWAELGYDQTEIGEFLNKRATMARASRGDVLPDATPA